MPVHLEVLGKLKVGCPGGSFRSCPPGAWPRRGRTWPLETGNGGTGAWSNFATYLRSIGAMALFCGGVDSSRIRLLGRWKSWTMLRYLHLQFRASMRGLSVAMLQGGKIDMLSPGSLPSIFPEPPDVPACITPKYSEVYETL